MFRPWFQIKNYAIGATHLIGGIGVLLYFTKFQMAAGICFVVGALFQMVESALHRNFKDAMVYFGIALAIAATADPKQIWQVNVAANVAMFCSGLLVATLQK